MYMYNIATIQLKLATHSSITIFIRIKGIPLMILASTMSALI